ncbi:uncharacterized protein LOC116267472 [Nymphaea colorata]|uniref:uncharacterized protein LOC116267472 n=1 Tax=Nymphaea colorata TaxID=210225 RepID=UPI00129E58E5|nr:uncharacterized protein LOC116267472 [Nymphaea colorata]
MMEDQGIWEAVEPTTGVAVDTMKDKKARSHLLQALLEDLLMQVAKKAMVKESDFDAMQMQEGEMLDQYAGRLTGMSVKYANLGGTLSNAALVKKLFDTVPNRFLSVIAGIKQFCDLDTMLFEESMGRLKTYEECSHPQSLGTGGNGDAQLLLTQVEWEARQKRSGGDPSLNRKERTHGEGGVRSRGGRGHGRGCWRGIHCDFPLKDRAGGSGGGGRDKSHIRCFNCDELGHYVNRCKALKKKEEAHLTQVDDTGPALLLVELEEVVSAALERPDWQEQQDVVLLNEEQVWSKLHGTKHGMETTDVCYLNNGANNHMTGNKVKFRELDEAITRKVKFGDGSSMQNMGKGSILFRCKNDDQWLLQEVYHIPRLRSNIVSLEQLTEAGHKVVMDEGELEVFVKNPWQLIMKAQNKRPSMLGVHED